MDKYTENELKSLKKDQLIELVLQHQMSRTRSTDGTLRKQQVLDLLKKQPMTILELSKSIDISTKNVSSQIHYLRKEHQIFTDNNGRKFLHDHSYVESNPEETNESVIEEIEVTEDELNNN